MKDKKKYMEIFNAFEDFLRHRTVIAPIEDTERNKKLIDRKYDLFCMIKDSLPAEAAEKFMKYDMLWDVIDAYRQEKQYTKGLIDAFGIIYDSFQGGSTLSGEMNGRD